MYFAAFLKNAYFFSSLYIGPIPIFLDVLKNKNGFQVHLGSRFVIIKIGSTPKVVDKYLL